MAAENKLSDRALKSLLGKVTDKQKTISDGRGLSARVSSKGAVSFVFFFRLGGRETSPIWMTLGRYPDMSLKSARERRDKCREWLAEGKDPRLYAKLREQQTLYPVTVKGAIDYWFDNYGRDKRKNHEMIYQKYENHIFKYIGHIPLSECNLSLWLSCFDKIKKCGPVQAGDILVNLKQIFKFCRVRQFSNYRELDDLKIDDVGAMHTPRETYLTKEQTREVWNNIFYGKGRETTGTYRSRILTLLMVFGCRMGEARLSEWNEWDFDNWIWTVPKEHSKEGNEIIRPIPEALRQWITDLHAETKDKQYVLGVYKISETVSHSVGYLRDSLKHFPKWCAHDLRRTLATNLSDMGVDFYVVESLLGHKIPGVAGVYNRSKYLNQKLEALNLWMAYLDSLVNEESNVTFIKRVS
ncbi:tyrosine-type recombinase/integrase [Buttiauxella gaviniae]|uniref:tyrosine-type recombinase/integrase n=1 Tax=Buttiauxella gaviniae TaxID=82990 RepID=UPI00397692DA